MSEVFQDAARHLVEWALAEDVGDGDRTTCWTVPAAAATRAEIVARESGVIAGLALAEMVFRELDEAVVFRVLAGEGAAVAAGEVVVALEGRTRAILTGERTALNFLQRLSGIATLARRFVDEVAGTGVDILDTRKTTPGWRLLEKAAVRAGGARNHRMGLHDAVLIKDNHIAAAGGIASAVAAVRRANDAGLEVEVEVRSTEELQEVLRLGVDRVLLDNMDLPQLEAAVRLARAAERPPRLEASGNMTLDRVRAVAATGVDCISVGALTHSAAALDLSLRVLRP